MAQTRQLKNTPRGQGRNEAVAYTVDTADWPGTGAVSAPSTEIEDDQGRRLDLAAVGGGGKYLSGNTTESAGVITTALVINLVPSRRYKLRVKWTKQGNTLEAWGWLDGEE